MQMRVEEDGRGELKCNNILWIKRRSIGEWRSGRVEFLFIRNKSTKQNENNNN